MSNQEKTNVMTVRFEAVNILGQVSKHTWLFVFT